MQPIRLALVTHSVITGDGQGRVNYEIARYGLKRGAQVTLLADRVAPELLEAGAEWCAVHPRVQRPDLAKVPDFIWRADRALKTRAHEFDVVCGNGCVLSRPHTVNCAHFVHGAWLRSPVHPFRIRRNWYGAYQLLYTMVNARAERAVFDRAEAVVAVSDKVKDELISIGVPEQKIHAIANGVDVVEFQPGHTERQPLGLPPDQVIAVFVGDLRTPRKNLDTVIRALTEVPEVHLAVVGDTSGSLYPRMAELMNLNGRVHFLGYRRDVAKIMRAADIFVFPSRYDPYSLVVLEAMASGLPVITATSVGAATLVTRECGYVLGDPEDCDGLVAALQVLTGDPERRRRMGQVARRVAEPHSWERMAAAYWKLFETVK
jgi:glycosyltransferase involved in cell wall biosynthesis